MKEFLTLLALGGWFRPWLAVLAIVALFPARASAEASQWSQTEHVQVRLVSATTGVGEATQLALGLHFRLDRGWKIYWRSPGDAGFPPAADWSDSQNLGAARLAWPAPERFSVLGFETVGYKDEVVLPLAVTLLEPGRPLALRGNLSFLACDEICIPYDAPLVLDLAAGPAAPSDEAHLIARFADAVPSDGGDRGLSLAGAAVESGASTDPVLRLAVRLADGIGGFGRPDAFVEGPPEVVFGPPRVRLAEAGRLALLDLPVVGARDLGRPLTGEPLTVTVVDGRRTAEWSVRPAAGLPTGLEATTAGDVAGLAVALGLAVLGGLILNLMPCVLPVLSIKLLSVVGHGGGDRRAVRRGFLASAAGILAAFLLLAGILAALKAGGALVGWGIQFQQPAFLVAMTAVVTLFAANLWGFFEIPLPRLFAHSAGIGRATRPPGDPGLTGPFFGGVFATVLATPCSAPFLGTAVGFALARGTAEIVLVFAALGLGLALPYLAVAAMPGLATRLPRPGPWMVTLRRILGFALAATAVWLLAVIDGHSGRLVSGGVAAAMLALLLLLFLGRRQAAGTARLAAAGAVGLVALALVLPAWLGPTGEDGVRRSLGGVWQPFDEAAIPRLVAEGRTVFVDVTADWCITCQVNKAAVLERGDVYGRLAAAGVIAMQADWTRPDPAIARFLARFGRYGIPFNVVFGPRAPDGIALPELLSPAPVLAAFDQAGQTVAAAAGR